MYPESQNWLTNERTYDAQRYSPVRNDQQGQRQESQAQLRLFGDVVACPAAKRVVSGVA